MIASRVGLKWTWVSISIGITVLPARLTRVAPDGTFTSAARPAATIRAPSTRSVAFSIGAPPSPTMRRAPSNAVTPVWAHAGEAKTARTPRANVVAKAATFTRRIGASTVKADSRTVARPGVDVEGGGLLAASSPTSRRSAIETAIYAGQAAPQPRGR